ncbi:MAG: hypothetical protein QNJ97_07585 [Myxococcota bacterium]|nr:hypothetical protein [Myxococcota bacterium]
MPSDPSTPRQARRAVAQARAERARTVADLDRKKEARDLARATQIDVDQAETAYAAAVKTLRTAQMVERAACEQLTAIVTAALPPDPADQIGQLEATYPAALLPVRLETRFHRTPNGDHPGELWVRIYPDGLVSDSHEPLLNKREIEDGHAAWRQAFEDGDAQEAWRGLISSNTRERAAWIVEQCRPQNAEQLGTAGVEPQFGTIEARPDRWTRSPEARLLPDRWIVSLYGQHRTPRRVYSSQVVEPLALSLTLGTDGEEPELNDEFELSDDGLRLPQALKWAFDFDQAVAVGMGLRIPLDVAELEQGFAKVLVMGMRTSAAPDEAAEDLTNLIQSLRHTRGLSFLRQGTPTNNTDGKRAGSDDADPNGTQSYAVAWGSRALGAKSDGRRVAEALGIDADALKRVSRADVDEQAPARAMAEALWPATIGYFVDQLIGFQANLAMGDALRDYFIDRVRGRGPFPALQVSTVPYGILPVGSLDLWRADRRASSVEQGLVPLLQRLSRYWEQAAVRAPHVFASDDADGDLLAVLGQTASTKEVFVRKAMGWEARWNLLAFLGLGPNAWEAERWQILGDLIETLGIEHQELDPRILYLDYAAEAHRFFGPLVSPPPLSEKKSLPFDYIDWVRNASIRALRDEEIGQQTKPNALLYLMLRHAMLALYHRVAAKELLVHKMIGIGELIEPELVGVAAVEAATGTMGVRVAGDAAAVARDATAEGVRATAWDHLGTVVPEVSTNTAIGDYVATNPMHTDAAGQVRPVYPEIAAYKAALGKLMGLPTAELERLFAETLDTCSHRFDAWVTSLFAGRLTRMRAEQATGLHVGAYGWVEDLRPDPPSVRQTVTLPDGTTAEALTDSGGYLYAPSMLHGAAAAVLRSAYLTRSGQDKKAYEINLSSRRVRTAMWLMDTVREDQPLGAALGYQFERGLHEGHPGVELDKFIAPFRSRYPLKIQAASQPSSPTESIAARNVVDGLRLQEAYKKGTIPWGQAGFVASSTERPAIEAELDKLDDAIDAVKDLLTAESVYQVLRGTPEGVSASLDTMAKGVRPPEPEIARVPRSGTAVYHRIALVLGGDPAPPLPGWAALPQSPRATAEPYLNAWLGRILGDPAQITCRATLPDASEKHISLADLNLQPLDFLQIAAAMASEPLDSELDRRVAEVVNRTAGADRPVTIDYTATSGTTKTSFAAVLEVAMSILELLGQVRALTPQDLLPPEQNPETADPMTAELTARATAASQRVNSAITGLDTAIAGIEGAPAGSDPPLGTLRTALSQVALLGVAGAYPRTHHGNAPEARSTLLDAAKSARDELKRRKKAAQQATDNVSAMQSLFGRSMLILPRFKPAFPEILGPAIQTGPDLGADPDTAVAAWRARASRVRPALDAWRRLDIYARMLGHSPAAATVAQIPHGTPPERWVGLSFTDESDRPLGGRLSLILERVGSSIQSATEPWVGLLLDDWSERIPTPEEDAGIAFHYDAPGAEAPSAILLAVMPEGPERWSLDYIEQTLNETLSLAKVRAVDGQGLGAFDQILPMTYLASNPKNEAISTIFVGMLVAEAIIKGQ